VAIVSPKAQTTRTRLMGVAIHGEAQILLLDTPGIFAPRRRLDRAMVAAAWAGTSDADLIALVVDAEAGFSQRIETMIDQLAGRREAKILVLNKVDLVRKDALLALAGQLNERVAFEETFMVSASTGDGVADLKAALAARVPEGPWHFPEDQVSDATDRMLAAEVTRVHLYLHVKVRPEWEEDRGLYQEIGLDWVE
jgi:GTP-binding protein Era